MTASHGSTADFFGNGYVLSQFLNSATFSASRDVAESTGFKAPAKTYVPGLKDTGMSVEGIYDGAANAVDEVFSNMLMSPTGAAIVMSYFPYGNQAIGNLAFSLDCIESAYEVASDIGDVNQITAEFSAGDTGIFTRGIVQQPMAVQGSGGNTTSTDGGAASTNGGGLVVHATAAASLVVKMQDSADNSAWADVAGLSITINAGRASVRDQVTGTIRRYTRVLWTGTGTFSAITERY